MAHRRREVAAFVAARALLLAAGQAADALLTAGAAADARAGDDDFDADDDDSEPDAGPDANPWQLVHDIARLGGASCIHDDEED
jgi:hypothetical protein